MQQNELTSQHRAAYKWAQSNWPNFKQPIESLGGAQWQYILACANESAPSAAFAGPAKPRWDAAIRAKRDAGMSAADAVRAVNKEIPGLRDRLVAEANC